jgi:hypothetical protein
VMVDCTHCRHIDAETPCCRCGARALDETPHCPCGARLDKSWALAQRWYCGRCRIWVADEAVQWQGEGA